MLVIRRHPGESIWIGDDVEIEVIDCGSNRVKLGIRAPQQVTVVRNEVRRTREQNLAASRAMAAGALPGVLERLRAGPRKEPS
jgi:carbon storage regulator